jgi:hypothetical protein
LIAGAYLSELAERDFVYLCNLDIVIIACQIPVVDDCSNMYDLLIRHLMKILNIMAEIQLIRATHGVRPYEIIPYGARALNILLQVCIADNWTIQYHEAECTPLTACILQIMPPAQVPAVSLISLNIFLI